MQRHGTCSSPHGHLASVGAVPADVEFGSAEFWELLKKVDVSDRMTKAGHKFPTTLHVLASAIKKLQVRSPVSIPLCVVSATKLLVEPASF